jgi:hypothetical protein
VSQAVDVGREGKKFTGGYGACQFKLTYYKLQAAQQEIGVGGQRRLCSLTETVEVGGKTDASTAFSPLPWGSKV